MNEIDPNGKQRLEQEASDVQRRLRNLAQLDQKRTPAYTHLERTLFRIQKAIIRRRSGTYGQCESCRKRISSARLQALPYAELCFDCQREREKKS